MPAESGAANGSASLATLMDASVADAAPAKATPAADAMNASTSPPEIESAHRHNSSSNPARAARSAGENARECAGESGWYRSSAQPHTNSVGTETNATARWYELPVGRREGPQQAQQVGADVRRRLAQVCLGHGHLAATSRASATLSASAAEPVTTEKQVVGAVSLLSGGTGVSPVPGSHRRDACATRAYESQPQQPASQLLDQPIMPNIAARATGHGRPGRGCSSRGI